MYNSKTKINKIWAFGGEKKHSGPSFNSKYYWGIEQSESPWNTEPCSAPSFPLVPNLAVKYVSSLIPLESTHLIFQVHSNPLPVFFRMSLRWPLSNERQSGFQVWLHINIIWGALKTPMTQLYPRPIKWKAEGSTQAKLFFKTLQMIVIWLQKVHCCFRALEEYALILTIPSPVYPKLPNKRVCGGLQRARYLLLLFIVLPPLRQKRVVIAEWSQDIDKPGKRQKHIEDTQC